MCFSWRGARVYQSYLCREITRRIKAEAEVERLKKKFKRAIEIADEFWGNQKQAVLVYHQELADELDQLKATMNHDKK